MALPAGVRALGHRDFRFFWIGQLVSLIGTWMQSVGQSWLVLELTNSPVPLGLVGTLQFGPILLFSFLGGAISDRAEDPGRRALPRGMERTRAVLPRGGAGLALRPRQHPRHAHPPVLHGRPG